MPVKLYKISRFILGMGLFGMFLLTPLWPGPVYAVFENDDSFELLIKFREEKNLVKESFLSRAELESAWMSYRQDARVEAVEPNYRYRASIIPSDPYFTSQWYLKKIKAPEAWSTKRNADNVIIAIIDSGIQVNHPDLVNNIWINPGEIAGNGLDDDRNGYIDDIHGWDFVSDLPDPSPKFSPGFTEEGIMHGTIVAGVAAAHGNNGIGVAGVAWQLKIMALKALGDDGSGDTADVVRAINYAIDNKANIINLSFVGSKKSIFLEQAIRRAHEAGILIVAAAGNDEGQGLGINIDEQALYPACHDGSPGENMIIGVTAVNALDEKAGFASYGFRCIDISAPGVSIFNTAVYAPDKSIGDKSFDRYYDGYWGGTSLATPMVSAAAALIWAANPLYKRDDVHNSLLRQSDNINPLNPSYFGKLGIGRLNVAASVEQAHLDFVKHDVRLVVAPYSDYEPVIRIVDQADRLETEFLAYAPSFRGGVSIAGGDVDGDGRQEIIAGPRAGGGPHIRVFKPDGSLVSQFFAYEESFRGGVSVAAGDIDGDGIADIVVGLGPGGPPLVRVFDKGGRLKKEFLAYASAFRGGISVAAGDVDGNGRSEIITGAGPGGGPQVRIFGGDGRLHGQFFAYSSLFRGGVNVAVGRVPLNGRHQAAAIITAPADRGGPHIRIFDNRARLLGQFFAYDPNYRGSVAVAAADLSRNGNDEIVTGAGPGGAPHLRVFDHQGGLKHSFYALAQSFAGGISVAAIKY